MPDKTSQERRRFIRIPSRDVLYLRKYSILAAEDKDKIRSVLKNISAGGVLLESRNRYDIGDVVKIEIMLPGWEKFKSEFYKTGVLSKTNPLIALASVVRIEMVKPGELYDLGFCFTAIDSGHQHALAKYIKSKLE